MFALIRQSDTPWRDAGSNIAAVILFVIWPFAQTVLPRATPVFLVLAVVSVLLFNAIGQLRGEGHWQRVGWPQLSLKNPVIVLFFAFLTLVVLSLFWSPMPERGAKDAGVMLAAFIAAVFLAHELPRVTLWPLKNFVALALIISSCGLALENWYITSFYDAVVSSNYLLDLNRNAASLLVLGCAALGYVSHGGMPRYVALPIGILVVFAIFSSQGEAVKLGVLAAAASVLLISVSPRLVKTLFALMVLAIIAMPLIAGYLANDSGQSVIPLPKTAHADHRIALWQGYAQLVPERFLLGHGQKGDRALGMSGRAATVSKQRGFPGSTTSPHNVALEIWTNQGLAGAILAACLLLAVGWRLAAASHHAKLSGVALTTAAFAVSMTGSSFFQGWWIATLAIGFVIWGCATRSME